jgi:hypothetical protein
MVGRGNGYAWRRGTMPTIESGKSGDKLKTRVTGSTAGLNPVPFLPCLRSLETNNIRMMFVSHKLVWMLDEIDRAPCGRLVQFAPATGCRLTGRKG